MATIVFDIIILLLVAYILLDIRGGFLMSLCCRVFLPHTVRFILGGISVSILDVLSISLILSYLIHRDEIEAKMPRPIVAFLVIDVVSSFILVFLSSKYVPVQEQLYCLVKIKVVGETLLYAIAYYALSEVDIDLITDWLMTVSIVCGIYGILGYVIRANPYMSIISLTYLHEDAAALAFMDETRGFLSGRIMGTMDHPLSWGQYWDVVIPFCILTDNGQNRRKLNAFIIIGIINVFLCGSRTALLALVIFGLFYLKYKGATQAFKYIALGAVLVLTISLVTPSTTKMGKYMKATFLFWNKDVADNAEISGSSLEMRLQQLAVGYDVISNSILGGYGYHFRAYAKEEGVSIEGMLGYESIVLSEMVEQGILGVIIYFFLFWILLSAIRSYWEIEGDKIYLAYGFVLCYLAAVVATGIQGVGTFFFMSLVFKYMSDCEAQKEIPVEPEETE